MVSSRDTLKTLILLSERAERYQDMFDRLIELVCLDEGLTEDERSLLSLACKNLVGPKRSACRCLAALEEKFGADDFKTTCTRELKDAVIAEIEAICKKLVDTVTAHILVRQNSPTDVVFYLKMCGDYHRYHAETLQGDKRAQVAKDAHDFYLKAYNIAVAELKPTSPVRLGLGLNLSVFYYEVEDNTALAKKTAREFLDAAVDKMGDDTENFKDNELIIQLLRDNLTLWNSESTATQIGEDVEEDQENLDTIQKVEAQ
ncbi:14-3-3 protein beta/alpha-B [Thelohanellus kitauei]|uniref:14-3-3 protein beta/alpha-B n=1 Tax=Thelohanellus kitauei TaxID=669202 RepID=A0A0C2N9E9_THEKT|nr:14-3-3 protein beta/alpha-B [Thelohanellus kitauei]